MKWTKKEKELIKLTIERYKKDLKIKDVDKRTYFTDEKYCCFCQEYSGEEGDCPTCPNSKINNILGIGNILSFPCETNAIYLSIIAPKSNKNIRLRIEFWESSLNDTKKEFIKKWKKEEK